MTRSACEDLRLVNAVSTCRIPMPNLFGLCYTSVKLFYHLYLYSHLHESNMCLQLLSSPMGG